MQAGVYYFSGTGNSFAVAKSIASNISGTLQPIAQSKKKEQILVTEDIVGIVFPVYLAQLYGLPEIVHRFICKAKFTNPKYVFVVCTYGGYGVVNAFPTIERCVKLLQSRGIKTSGRFYVRMPLNNLDYDHIPIPIEQDHKIIFRRSRKRVEAICRRIDDQTKSLYLFQRTMNMVLSPMCHFLKPSIVVSLRRTAQELQDSQLTFHELIPLTDKSIQFDEDKCSGCGTCERVCPVRNIEIVERKPRWKHECEMCFACDEWCPTKAIHHWGKRIGKDYHHPEVSVREMMEQNGSAQS